MRYHIFVAAFIAFMLLGSKPLCADVVFIVHPSSQIKSVDKKMIKDIFLGNIIKWPDNTDVSFVLTNDPGLHKSFLRQYLKRNSTQFMNYWRQMLFSGKGRVPKALSQTEVLQFVAAHEGAVGYVKESADLSKVKILPVSQ